MTQHKPTNRYDIWLTPINPHWWLLRLIMLLLLLSGLPAQAADYIFSPTGTLPVGCNINASSTNSYNCGSVTLAVGDTISVEETRTYKPVTITFTGAFTTAVGNLINTAGTSSDLNIVTNGGLTLGADTTGPPPP